MMLLGIESQVDWRIYGAIYWHKKHSRKKLSTWEIFKDKVIWDMMHESRQLDIEKVQTIHYQKCFWREWKLCGDKFNKIKGLWWEEVELLIFWKITVIFKSILNEFSVTFQNILYGSFNVKFQVIHMRYD